MSVQARKVVFAAGMLLLVLAVPIAGNSTKPEMTGYATPGDAANALIAAAKAGDQNALLAILGPESKLLNSGIKVPTLPPGPKEAFSRSYIAARSCAWDIIKPLE